MAPTYYSIIFSFVVFLAMLNSAAGLTCYSCSACNTVDGATSVVNVSNNAGYSCKKTVYLAASIVTSTSRSATLNCTSVDSVIAGTGTKTTCCTSDLCNGSVSLKSSMVLALAFVGLVAILRFKNVD